MILQLLALVNIQPSPVSCAAYGCPFLLSSESCQLQACNSIFTVFHNEHSNCPCQSPLRLMYQSLYSMTNTRSVYEFLRRLTPGNHERLRAKPSTQVCSLVLLYIHVFIPSRLGSHQLFLVSYKYNNMNVVQIQASISCSRNPVY